jgi:hypothetical protein
MKLDYIYNPEEKKGAPAILIYGSANVGKTGSITTLPANKNVIALNAESKDLAPVIQSIGGFNSSLRIVTGLTEFDQYEDFINDLHMEYEKGNCPHDIIFFDGLSFLASTFRMEFEDSRFDLGLSETNSKGERKRTNTIADRFRIEVQDWGGLASAMMRVTGTLVSFTKYDVTVIATAHRADYPSWDKDLDMAPAFAGKGYSSIMSGYWHYIGLVTPGAKVINGFPLPQVSFMSTDPSSRFLARSSSNLLNEKMANNGGVLPLNWKGILQVIEKGGGNNNG